MESETTPVLKKEGLHVVLDAQVLYCKGRALLFFFSFRQVDTGCTSRVNIDRRPISVMAVWKRIQRIRGVSHWVTRAFRARDFHRLWPDNRIVLV